MYPERRVSLVVVEETQAIPELGSFGRGEVLAGVRVKERLGED